MKKQHKKQSKALEEAKLKLEAEIQKQQKLETALAEQEDAVKDAEDENV